jgi:hypothetical protein
VGTAGAERRCRFSEEWLEHFRALTGGRSISPLTIANARKNSTYWNANEAQTPNLALFFLAATQPDYLAKAPGGAAYLTTDQEKLTRGKTAFAERCARCHSSKLPEKAYSFFPNGCVGPNYLNCWNEYWKWTKTDEFKQQIKQIVMKDDFLKDNYLSTDLRVPVTLLETNACSPLATNAIAGNSGITSRPPPIRSFPQSGRSRYTILSPVSPRSTSCPPVGKVIPGRPRSSASGLQLRTY